MDKIDQNQEKDALLAGLCEGPGSQVSRYI